MDLGQRLAQARRAQGLSQEAAAEALGISRQTISKWENGETLPDIQQARALATLYGVTLDELVAFDREVQEIRAAIARTTEETQQRVDWTQLWGERYPVLTTYQQVVDVEGYAALLKGLLARLEETYGYSREDAFLVLKDILGNIWQGKA